MIILSMPAIHRVNMMLNALSKKIKISHTNQVLFMYLLPFLLAIFPHTIFPKSFFRQLTQHIYKAL